MPSNALVKTGHRAAVIGQLDRQFAGIKLVCGGYKMAPPITRISPDIDHADIDKFDTIIDVRSPAEFADDHIPGAINLPVLDDQQRAKIGTIYKQINPFTAKRAGCRFGGAKYCRAFTNRFKR